jgi:hypothetical protein
MTSTFRATTGPWGALDVPQMFDAGKDLVFSESAMRWTSRVGRRATQTPLRMSCTERH